MARDDLPGILKRVRIPLTLTWAGLMAERLCVAFWPLWTLIAATAAGLILGLHDLLSLELFWGLAVLTLISGLGTVWYGAHRLRWPRRAEALARMDTRLPGHPFAALADAQAVGRGDPASETIWEAHRLRMAARAATARPIAPDLRIARLDPFGLRYIALLGLTVALLFGSLTRVLSIADHALGRPATAASGPVWEGWVEPPSYTGLPSLYLADQPDSLQAPAGSLVTIRFYGPVGKLSLAETVSARTEDIEPATSAEHQFPLAQSGELRISGPGGRFWQVTVLPDTPPQVIPDAAALETGFDGTMSLPFAASDDYGVTGGTARVALDLGAVPRRYGLAVPPEPRAPFELTLPMPLTGDRSDFTEVLTANMSQDAWAHLPVSLSLDVGDAAGQTGAAVPLTVPLPARRFFDPVASALIEMRRDLLWSRANAARVAQVLRAISDRPGGNGLFRSEARDLALRQIIRRLERFSHFGMLTPEARDSVAGQLWDLALAIEDGDIADALERLREAQERLNDAMRNGASPQEIARLMQELRDATQDYLRQKAQQAQRQEDGTDEPDQGQQDSIELSRQDLQAMMDRIQELMEQGRMAEAQQALEEYQRLLESLQTAQRQSGPGQQALDGLADTLRNQQDLSDESFRDLQDQFNRGGADPLPGDSPNGQQGQGQGDPSAKGADGQQGQEQGLAERQRALRDRLQQQRQGLPQGGREAGEALDRAGRAMREAEDALRDGDTGQAIDRQAEAMDALRDGMQALAEQMSRQAGQGQRGGQPADRTDGRPSDPLGRAAGRSGRIDSGETLHDQDVRRRAQELLDEIRRRSAEVGRPEPERDYLRRLLDRF